MKKDKETDMVIDLQDANILPLDITKRQVKYLIDRVNKLKDKEIILAKGKVNYDFIKFIYQVLHNYLGQTITLKAVIKDE